MPSVALIFCLYTQLFWHISCLRWIMLIFCLQVQSLLLLVEELVTIATAGKPATMATGGTLTGRETESDVVTVQQLALFSLKLMCKILGAKHPKAFAKVQRYKITCLMSGSGPGQSKLVLLKFLLTANSFFFTWNQISISCCIIILWYHVSYNAITCCISFCSLKVYVCIFSWSIYNFHCPFNLPFTQEILSRFNVNSVYWNPHPSSNDNLFKLQYTSSNCLLKLTCWNSQHTYKIIFR